MKKIFSILMLFAMLTLNVGAILGENTVPTSGGNDKVEWKHPTAGFQTSDAMAIARIIIRCCLAVDVCVLLGKWIQGKEIGKGAVALLVAMLICNILFLVFGGDSGIELTKPPEKK